jgi:hypothetical protein
VTLYMVTRDEERHPPLALPSEIVGPDPLSYESGRTAAYERAAAFGLSHVLFAKSPGGVVAAASRTATFRPMVEDVWGAKTLVTPQDHRGFAGETEC